MAVPFSSPDRAQRTHPFPTFHPTPSTATGPPFNATHPFRPATPIHSPPPPQRLVAALRPRPPAAHAESQLKAQQTAHGGAVIN